MEDVESSHALPRGTGDEQHLASTSGDGVPTNLRGTSEGQRWASQNLYSILGSDEDESGTEEGDEDDDVQNSIFSGQDVAPQHVFPPRHGVQFVDGPIPDGFVRTSNSSDPLLAEQSRQLADSWTEEQKATRHEVHKIRFSSERCHAQSQSPLFSTLPPEIRDMIFHLALMDYEDLSRPYEPNTPYSRPGYLAPRRTDTALLRTCQRVYQETWFRGWSSALQTLWFAGEDRRPPYATTVLQLASNLRRIHEAGIDVEIDHVRIFAQMYRLEDGVNLDHLLSYHHFRPRCITISIRHTDWWFWERDEPLRMNALFTMTYFPDSLQEIRLELESLERKKGQIDYLVREMKGSWWFRRRDERRLLAHDTPVETETRTGSSRWGGKRWLRDEVAPNTLKYYMVTISWRFEPATDSTVGQMPRPLDLHSPPIPPHLRADADFVTEEAEKYLHIPHDATTEEATRMLLDYNSNPEHGNLVPMITHDVIRP